MVYVQTFEPEGGIGTKFSCQDWRFFPCATKLCNWTRLLDDALTVWLEVPLNKPIFVPRTGAI